MADLYSLLTDVIASRLSDVYGAVVCIGTTVEVIQRCVRSASRHPASEAVVDVEWLTAAEERKVCSLCRWWSTGDGGRKGILEMVTGDGQIEMW